jgi:RNA polymerase sigma factor (sigma-70 family)
MSNEHKLLEVFVGLRRKLARAVSRIVPPPEIEDIVQETYVRMSQFERVASIRHPRSFLYRTARNLALDHIKRVESRSTVSLPDDAEDEDGDNALPQGGLDVYDQLAATQEFEIFCAAVEQLPLQCRRVFVLRKVYGYSQKEIARALDISESTVEKHIAYGIRRCSSFLAERTGTAERSEPPKVGSIQARRVKRALERGKQ